MICFISITPPPNNTFRYFHNNAFKLYYVRPRQGQSILAALHQLCQYNNIFTSDIKHFVSWAESQAQVQGIWVSEEVHQCKYLQRNLGGFIFILYNSCLLDKTKRDGLFKCFFLMSIRIQRKLSTWQISKNYEVTCKSLQFRASSIMSILLMNVMTPHLTKYCPFLHCSKY